MIAFFMWGKKGGKNGKKTVKGSGVARVIGVVDAIVGRAGGLYQAHLAHIVGSKEAARHQLARLALCLRHARIGRVGIVGPAHRDRSVEPVVAPRPPALASHRVGTARNDGGAPRRQGGGQLVHEVRSLLADVGMRAGIRAQLGPESRGVRAAGQRTLEIALALLQKRVVDRRAVACAYAEGAEKEVHDGHVKHRVRGADRRRIEVEIGRVHSFFFTLFSLSVQTPCLRSFLVSLVCSSPAVLCWLSFVFVSLGVCVCSRPPECDVPRLFCCVFLAPRPADRAYHRQTKKDGSDWPGGKEKKSRGGVAWPKIGANGAGARFFAPLGFFVALVLAWVNRKRVRVYLLGRTVAYEKTKRMGKKKKESDGDALCVSFGTCALFFRLSVSFFAATLSAERVASLTSLALVGVHRAPCGSHETLTSDSFFSLARSIPCRLYGFRGTVSLFFFFLPRISFAVSMVAAQDRVCTMRGLWRLRKREGRKKRERTGHDPVSWSLGPADRPPPLFFSLSPDGDDFSHDTLG